MGDVPHGTQFRQTGNFGMWETIYWSGNEQVQWNSGWSAVTCCVALDTACQTVSEKVND